MKEEKSLVFAGDLLDEVNEISKIRPEEDSIELAISHTAICSPFLTIYCC